MQSASREAPPTHASDWLWYWLARHVVVWTSRRTFLIMNGVSLVYMKLTDVSRNVTHQTHSWMWTTVLQTQIADIRKTGRESREYCFIATWRMIEGHTAGTERLSLTTDLYSDLLDCSELWTSRRSIHTVCAVHTVVYTLYWWLVLIVIPMRDMISLDVIFNSANCTQLVNMNNESGKRS